MPASHHTVFLAGAIALCLTQACAESPTAPLAVGRAPAAGGAGTSAAGSVANASPPFGGTQAPASTRAISSDSAAARVMRILPGAQVLATRADDEHDIPTWKVVAGLANGARLSFELLQANGVVISVEGDVGPFDYDLVPGNGIASLATAMAAAKRAQAGAIVKWELELEDDRRWEYEFYMRDSLGAVWEIELDARTLALLGREPRGRGNDDDNSNGSSNGGSNDSDDDGDDVMTGMSLPDSIRQRALAMVTGATLREVETGREDGLHLWKLDFEGPSGLEIKLRLLMGDGTLMEAEGDERPTEGNLNPGQGLLDLSTARTRALAARPGTLEEWTLSRNTLGALVWRFEIEYSKDDYAVRIDATSGAVTVVRDDD